MSLTKLFAGAAAFSLAVSPIAVSAADAPARDAAPVAGESELGGGELPWIIGPLLVVGAIVAILVIADENEFDDPVSV